LGVSFAASPPVFAVPPAEVPPADSPLLSDAPLSLPPLEAASSLLLDSSPDPVAPSSLDLAVEVFEALVEVVCTAAFSALVSVGGVMSGVLFGTVSLTLEPPPQAPRPTAQSSKMLAASQALN
jgi:hypothetical protein